MVMLLGSTSGIPPTLVVTTNNPQEAASTNTVPNASVKDGCPSPAMRKFTLSLAAQIFGIIPANKSAPLLGNNLDMTTMVIFSLKLRCLLGFGLKSSEITAFGITDTNKGLIAPLNTMFSLHVFETQITLSQLFKVNFNVLFPRILPMSANP
ncbi:hypothetical protein WICPIJ_003824 [Wickerhamomyces pijperi]|uniref:Uncharacterized protein n=1 Tax=Wickerhamomyces pijperi TaxID=599730 RepID=A0A9P8Q8Y1_WICPI|nr:hypothetical protein WICPIJ_003824 [Wickerhamomyces pijperi]